ncbi:MAG: hypothetical protein HN764_12110 [Gammaproteobacteria bacterium]|nr:hypothetical protein [Gammaproteobacteria bacterium]
MSDRMIYRLDWWISMILKTILIIGAILEFLQGNWLNAFATSGIVVIVFVPIILSHQLHVRIPSEFEFLTVVFVYASLFLGDMQGFYVKYWWWDILLHTSSGLIMGILGFLLVHVINEHERLQAHMKPSFVALFAFMFSLGMGAIWEMFEFLLDQVFGMNTQAGGLQDTMIDLIVDGFGALTISLIGYSYLRTTKIDSFIERWINNFIRLNQRLFPKKGKGIKS